MYKLLRKLLFIMPPEAAHHFTTGMFKLVGRIPGVRALLTSIFSTDGNLERTVMGITFPNPVGLAAGFDKNADFINEFKTLGFGFIEVGTVTPKAQPGNDKPRMFRIQSDKALINRMGFNNDGLAAMQKALKKRLNGLIIGGNIGKNKVTPNEKALDDYVICFEGLYDYVDYFVVNVSSPNTPNLRELQDKEPLTKLLNTISELNSSKSVPKPILLKIAPDLTEDQLDDILDIVKLTGIDGVIATNTTISRDGLSIPESAIDEIGTGGLSGRPLRERSTEVVRYLRDRNKNMVIIGVGGITDEKSALEKLNAGADLIQVYTGFIYEGPSFVKRINSAILKNIEEG